MTMTSSQLVDLLSAPFADGPYRGRLMFAGQHRNGLPPAEAPLLDALLSSTPAVPVVVTEPYRNPVRAGVKYPEQPKALSQADLMWLDRLPGDPAAVSDKDARALATLALNAQHGSGDARLLDSLLEPVVRLHAQREAAAALDQLKAIPAAMVPVAVAQPLLAAAIAHENPGLTPVEVANRSADAVREASTRAAQARAERVAAAQSRADALLESAAS